MTEASTAEALFYEYGKTKDIELRNKLVLRYMDIVKYVAVSLRNTYSKYADMDDIVNEGVLSLIKAVETFDTGRGVKFETYANLKIKGAIIDFVRKQDWVPRQLRHFGKDLDLAYNQLYTELGRQPTNDELAEKLSMTKEKLLQSMADIAGAVTLSFEELLYEDNFDNYDKQGSETADRAVYERELREVIARAVDELKPKEKQVVTLYYYERLKFGEIAKVLGVTESRICQIHSKSMLLLKRKLEEYVRGGNAQ